MFNRSVLLFLIYIIGCSEIPSNKKNDINTYFIPEKSGTTKFINYSIDCKFNGYNINECIHGSFFCKNDYHKIIIFTKKHGTLVSKYAYAIRHYNNYNNFLTGGYINSKWVYTKFENVYYINIMNNMQTLSFVNEIRKKLLDEIKNVYITTYEGILFITNEVYLLYNNNIKLLTKSEYEIWMQEHQDTRIMRY
jgi:hypothetical protein